MCEPVKYATRKDMTTMSATPLQIAHNLHLTPLIDMKNPTFAKHYQDGLYWSLYVDFYLGALHGCLLSPEGGAIRSDVRALATFTPPDAAKGYYVGRRDCSMGRPPNERIYRDSELLEELCQ